MMGWYVGETDKGNKENIMQNFGENTSFVKTSRNCCDRHRETSKQSAVNVRKEKGS